MVEDNKKQDYMYRTKNIPFIHKKSIFLLLTPEHSNLGDHAIAQAEKIFFKKYFPKMPLYEINYYHYVSERENIRKKIHRNDIVVITGGGYLGDVWRNDDEMVRSIVREYPNNQIVIMPQTIYYSDSSLFEDDKNDYESHENLLFCVRDLNSYKLLETLAMSGKSRVVFVPDIVLSLDFRDNKTNRTKIGICLRNDREKVVSDEILDAIEGKLISVAPVKKFSTLLDNDIGIEERDQAIYSKMTEFKECKFVITDRLHAMLFAVITSTPCIVTDNLTRKVSGVYYKWLKDIEYVQFWDINDDIEPIIKKILNSNTCGFSYEVYFNELQQLIKERFKRWRMQRD